jgi:hypothetical protein
MELYVWGTGCAAGDLTDRGLTPEKITAFVDSSPNAAEFLGRPVLHPEALRDMEEGLILVASRHTEEIARQAAGLGIREDRLLFLKNNWEAKDRNSAYAAAEGLLPPEQIEALRRAPHLVREPLCISNSPLTQRDLENDYVRLRTLELLCRELDAVPGAAAELGVYRGAFAACINALLPERRLYLFDSFEGFAEAEAADQAAGLVEAHRNTDEARVLSLLPHPERAVIRKGFFPETARGLEEERFALVSLDADLEESTLQGLRWFWPRLSPGGYLLLHDWDNPRLPGVKRALKRYEEELRRRLPAVPLCDVCGTLVLTRGDDPK